MPVLAAIHVSFATSDLARDTQYFETVLQGSKIYETASSPEGTTYAGKMLSTYTKEVWYVQSTSKTQGPVTMAEWESYQTNLHSKCFDSTNNQGFDRLADNHFGHALGQSGVKLDAYVKAQIKAGLPYRWYGGGRTMAFPPSGGMYFFYMYGTNGWGVQLICSCSDASLCPSSSPGGYGMCTQGITGDCRHDKSLETVV